MTLRILFTLAILAIFRLGSNVPHYPVMLLTLIDRGRHRWNRPYGILVTMHGRFLQRRWRRL